MAMRRFNSRIAAMMRYPAHRIYTSNRFQFMWDSTSAFEDTVKFQREDEFQQVHSMSDSDEIVIGFEFKLRAEK